MTLIRLLILLFPLSLPSVPTLARALVRVHTQRCGGKAKKKKRLACLIVFYFGVRKDFGSRRETERGLRSRGAEERRRAPCLRSPSSVWSHHHWSHWLYQSSGGRAGGGRRGAPRGGGGGGLRGSAEDHPVVELPIFRRRPILGLNKAGTTAEDHGGCGLVALRLPRLSQGNAPGCCVLAFQRVFYRGAR